MLENEEVESASLRRVDCGWCDPKRTKLEAKRLKAGQGAARGRSEERRGVVNLLYRWGRYCNPMGARRDIFRGGLIFLAQFFC